MFFQKSIRFFLFTALCFWFSLGRSQNIDAGIDSISVASGFCQGDSSEICVNIHNFSTADTIDSVNVTVQINQVNFNSPVFVSGLSLFPGEDTVICFGFTFLATGDTILAFTTPPAGFTDTVSSNDSSFIVVSLFPLPTVNADNDTTVCALTPVTLGGSPTSTAPFFAWSNGGLLDDSTIANPTATLLGAGTQSFIVTVTDTNGCTNQDTVNITALAIPVVDAGADTTVCNGVTVQIGGSPTAVAGYVSLSWTNSFFLDNDSIENPMATPNISVDFIVTVVDTNGCSNQDTTFVFVSGIPGLQAGVDSTICLGDSAMLGAIPIANNYASLYWSPGIFLNDSTLANPLAAPTDTTAFVVFLTDTFGCTYTDTMVVNVLSLPVIDAGADTSVCPMVQFQIGGSPSGPSGAEYLWNPASFLNDSTLANPTASMGVNAVTFYMLVTDSATGCQATDSVIISIDSLPLADVGADTFTLCENEVITIGGAPTTTAGNQVSWSPGADLNDSTIFNPQLTGAQSYYLYLTVTDAGNGCTSMDTALVISNSLPDLDAGADFQICLGDTSSVGGSPTSNAAAQFLWSPAGILSSATVSNPIVTPTQDTTLFITVTSNEGCESFDSVFVDVNPLPTAVINTPVQVCQGDTTQLIGSGGVSFNWSPGADLSDSTIANPMAWPANNTLYTLTVANVFGCTDTAQVFYQFYPLPLVNAGSDVVLCNGSNAQLNATGAAVYQWSPANGLSATNISNPVATPNSTIEYFLTGTDTNNCINIDSITVSVNVLPAVDAGGPFTVCANATVQIGGSPTAPAGSTYLWPGANITNTTSANPVFDANGLSVGNHTVIVTVTDVNNCVNTDQATINVLPLPNAAIVAINNPICVGETLTITATGGVSYQWSPAASLSFPSLSSTDAFPTVTTTYTVTVTGANTCTQTAQATLPVYPLTAANAGSDASMCQQDAIQLSASGGVSYMWNNTSSLSNGFVANPISNTIVTRTYTVTVTDANSCTGTDQVTITVNPLPNVGAGLPKTICAEKSTVIGGNPTGPAGSTYVWSPAATLNNFQLSNPTAFPLQTTTYYVTVTTQFGCSDSASTVVTVDTLPSILVLSAPAVICKDDSTSAVITHGFETYSWSPVTNMTGISSDSAVFFPKTSTNYTVTVTDANGCTSTSSLLIEVLPLPIPDAGFDIEICEGDSTFIRGEGGVLYNWSDGGSLRDSNARETMAYPLETTDYTLTVTDTNGCENTDVKRVVVHPLPLADAGSDIENCDQSVMMLGGNPTGPPDGIYYWTPQAGLNDPFSPNPTVLTIERISYALEVQDENGCKNVDTVLVNADCYAVIYAPTAFTPGNNGVNDEFKLVHYRIIEPALTIYDRWGQLIFQTKDLDIGWDGSYLTGRDAAPAGVYHWELSYKSDEKKKLSKKGTVTLIR